MKITPSTGARRRTPGRGGTGAGGLLERVPARVQRAPLSPPAPPLPRLPAGPDLCVRGGRGSWPDRSPAPPAGSSAPAAGGLDTVTLRPPGRAAPVSEAGAGPGPGVPRPSGGPGRRRAGRRDPGRTPVTTGATASGAGRDGGLPWKTGCSSPRPPGRRAHPPAHWPTPAGRFCEGFAYDPDPAETGGLRRLLPCEGKRRLQIFRENSR